MGNAISGKGGAVNKGGAEIAHIRKWSIEPTAELKPYNSSSTSGHTARVAGNDDWTASAELYLDDGAIPAIAPGTAYDWEFDIDGTNKYSGNGFVAGTPVEVDVEGAELVGMTVNIEGNGALTNT